ncbi:hypothetical protein YTPLAS18_10160 [Nitrospira sp.]|nr:hypothetical protein YTPLAS18_10160 [Nitrospira sp.]
MDIVIAGEGEVIIRYIDSKGGTLLQEKLVVSGSPTVEGRRVIDLSIQTKYGLVPVAPVLVRQSNPTLRVTFDGETPSRFTQQRCREIGCPTKVVKAAASGRVAPPAPAHDSVQLRDDATFAKHIQAVARGKVSRS